MKTHDLIIVGAVVMILSFPLMWLVMLLATGNARLVFENDLARMIEVQSMARLQRNTERRDSLIVSNAYSFHANINSIDSLNRERERMEREQERLNFLIDELRAERLIVEAERKKIQGERTRFEAAIDNQANIGAVEQTRRVNNLARTYQAMRPAEAAMIMQELSPDLSVAILNAITDDRQRSRILSAMENSGLLTEMMGL